MFVISFSMQVCSIDWLSRSVHNSIHRYSSTTRSYQLSTPLLLIRPLLILITPIILIVIASGHLRWGIIHSSMISRAREVLTHRRSKVNIKSGNHMLQGISVDFSAKKSRTWVGHVGRQLAIHSPLFPCQENLNGDRSLHHYDYQIDPNMTLTDARIRQEILMYLSGISGL